MRSGNSERSVCVQRSYLRETTGTLQPDFSFLSERNQLIVRLRIIDAHTYRRIGEHPNVRLSRNRVMQICHHAFARAARRARRGTDR